MKIIKGSIAFVLAAVLMVSAMTVFAGSEYTYKPAGEGEEFNNYDFTNGGLIQDNPDGKVYQGLYTPTGVPVGTKWMNANKDEADYIYTFEFDGTDWVYSGSNGNWKYGGKGLVVSSGCSLDPNIASDMTGSLTEQEIADIASHAEAAAVQGAAHDEGFENVGDMYRAAEKNMSAGEYYNNAVTSTPGIENAVTVGQGGNLVVNGETTNMTATITKVTNRAYVDSIRIEQEGTVLNVVDVQFPAVEATINFYMPGVTEDAVIEAYQYVGGLWVDIDVVEVRADHVVLNMQGNGVVAFIAK